MSEPRIYYADETVTLWLGDCLDVLPTLTPVDHVITDPPYAVLVVNTSKGASGNTVGQAKRRDLGYAGIDDDIRGKIGAHFGRIVNRWALVFCDSESLTAWRLALESGGLRHIRCGAWVSPACTPQFTGDRPGTGWEACEIAHSTKGSRWNGGGSPAVWIFNRPVNGSADRIDAGGHPTPKPIPLMTQLIADFTDEGETILDPFAGSGTTGVAAKLNGRKAILIEKNKAYCAIAAKRLRECQPGRLFENLPRAKQQSLLEKP